MTSIIFPINNKGGIGKTSLLIDLMTMLSHNYSVGVIDTDGQGTLYDTLTGEDSLQFHDIKYYEDLETKLVTLQEGNTFRFAQGQKRSVMKLNEAVAPVTHFPVGMIHKKPNTVEKLEKIVTYDMKDVKMLGVDLPPIPDPDLILNYSIFPMIEMLGEKTKVFPIIMLTPEKNTIHIGLQGYKQIKKYFEEKGIPEENIHPIAVINRVVMDKKVLNNSGVYKIPNENDAKKLTELGLIVSKRPKHLGHFKFNEIFSLEGENINTVAIPLFSDGRTGSYGFLRGMEEEIITIPEFQAIAKEKGFPDKKGTTTGYQDEYAKKVHVLSSLIEKKSIERKEKNYTVEHSEREKVEAKTRYIQEVRTALADVYQVWDAAESESLHNQRYDLNCPDIIKYGGIWYDNSTHLSITLNLPRDDFDVETIAESMAQTETEFGLKIPNRRKDEWKPGDKKYIAKKLVDSYRNKAFEIMNPSMRSSGWEFSIQLKDFSDEPYDKIHQLQHREAFDTFLGHLDTFLYKQNHPESVKR